MEDPAQIIFPQCCRLSPLYKAAACVMSAGRNAGGQHAAFLSLAAISKLYELNASLWRHNFVFMCGCSLITWCKHARQRCCFPRGRWCCLLGSVFQFRCISVSAIAIQWANVWGSVRRSYSRGTFPCSLPSAPAGCSALRTLAYGTLPIST